MTRDELERYYDSIFPDGDHAMRKCVALRRDLGPEQMRTLRGRSCICGECARPRTCVGCGDYVTGPPAPYEWPERARSLVPVVHNAPQNRCDTCGRPWWCER